MKHIALATCLTISALALAGCGDTPGDRAVSGGAIGAGVGAVGGAMVGAPVEGAAIGAGVGATTGAVTTNRQIDLGRPAWQQ